MNIKNYNSDSKSSKELGLKIYVLVVLYNPTQKIIKNLEYFTENVDHFIIIDNSDYQDYTTMKIFIENNRINYIFNGENLGIAAALNKGAEIGIDNGADYLLLLDQDTKCDITLLDIYYRFLENNNNDTLGALIPTIIYDSNFQKDLMFSPKEVEYAITSGTLLNLQAFKNVGQFNSNLFIDYVDFEYCLRLRKNGFKLFLVPGAKIYHQLGDLKSKKIFFKQIYITNHSPIRYYYRTRNRFYVAKEYFFSFPLFVLKDILVFLNEFIKIILFESEKTLKIKMIIWGLRDFLINRYGKY
jgi:rhamnosyltransferase